MKKVLFITYLFPPYGGPMAQRSARFVSYLSEFGYIPFVLTIKIYGETFRSGTGTLYHLDESLENTLRGKTYRVERTAAWQPVPLLHFLYKHRLTKLTKLIFVPDSHVFWIFPAWRAASRMIRENNIDLIYVSASPFSSLLLGMGLRLRFRIPWVVDFRDPWTNFYLEFWATRFHYWIDRWLEQLVYRWARKVIFVTPGCKDILRTAGFATRPEQIRIITNGYRRADFLDLPPQRQHGAPFTISYVGRFYRAAYIPDNVRWPDKLKKKVAKLIEYRISDVREDSASPYYFLAAVRLLCDRYPRVRHDLRVRFIGPLDAPNSILIERLGLGDIVEITGFLPHAECIARMKESDVLLYMIGEGTKPLYHIASKVFEYMASEIPILALVPEGDSKDILEKSGLAFFAPPADREAIAQKIQWLYESWQKGELQVTPKRAFIDQYEGRKLAEQLAGVFDEACAPESRCRLRSKDRQQYVSDHVRERPAPREKV